MSEDENEERVFEMGVVIPRRVIQEEDKSCDCAHVLVKEFEKVGFEVERVIGIADEFIKVRFFSFLLYVSFMSVTFIQCYSSILYSSYLEFFFFLFGMHKKILSVNLFQSFSSVL